MILLYVTVFVVLASWLYFLRDCKDCNAPGPRPLPILGNALMFIGPPTSFLPLLRRLNENWGNTVRVHLFSKRYLVLYHPKYIEILCTLSFLAHGSYQKALAKNMDSYISQSSVSRAIHAVVNALNHPNIVKKYIRFPQNESERQALKKSFYEKFKIPGVIGCIDGTLVAMIRPNENEEMFYCRKGYHARNAMLPLVSRPDLITKGRSYDFLRPWLGEGLLTSAGTRWKTHRKFLTPAFHFNILQNFLPVFQKNEKILIQRLKRLADGQPVDLFPIIALNALDNVTESIMGVSINAQKDSESEYVKSINVLAKIVAMRMRNPFVAENAIFYLTSYKRDQDNALKVLHGHTKDVIEERRKELQSLNITSLDAQTDMGIRNKHAFLDLLLLTETDNKRISDKSIQEEVDTFMFEGHDTTTSGISFALFLMAQHPDVQEKILEEQRAILGDDFNRDPTYSELQQMKYLELVIKESLRIYPSVPLIERLITKDTVIADINVKRNTSIIIDIYHMHRSPELFEDPLEFKPERFESQSAKNAFSWLAFSAGPRNCIGQKFALLEMKVTLSGVIKHFKVLPTNDELQLCADLILRSENGVRVKFKAR